MLKEIKFLNWKSFEDATLFIDPLTVLIGTNASGKSNIIDGIAFLNRIIQGKELQGALDGENGVFLDATIGAIRGGSEWAAMKPFNEFTIEALIGENDNVDYRYSITVDTSQQVIVKSESLVMIQYIKDKPREINLFTANLSAEDIHAPVISVFINSGYGKLGRKDLKNTLSSISQLKNYELKPKVTAGIKAVSESLEGIFILDPVPSLMRNYTAFSPQLSRNASNLAGMLAALPEERKVKIEKSLSEYLSKLPEGEIEKVWSEPIGKFKKDAMLYCEEMWVNNKTKVIVDARGMSDGTLRFLGIITALLTRPKETLVVIEEVDNGLHPSRAKLLIKMLKDIGKQRNIDILITTHNPALMDELGIEMIPFIQVIHRSNEKGTSVITLLEDLKNLPKLLAHGSLGTLTSKGEIEKSISENGVLKDEE